MPAPSNDDGDQQVRIASTATSRSGINFNLARTRSLALQVFGFRCERKSAERQSSAGNVAECEAVFPRFSRVFLVHGSSGTHGSACLRESRLLRSRCAAASLSISPPLAAASWKFYRLDGGGSGGGGKSNSRELIYGLIKGPREHAAAHNLLDERRGPTLALQ